VPDVLFSDPSGEHVPAMVERGLLTATVTLLVKLSHEETHDARVRFMNQSFLI